MKVLFLVTEDWYFLSHRLPLARAARDRGHEVVVATRVDRGAARILAEGFRLVPIRLERSGLGLLNALSSVAAFFRLYRREKPDLVHHVAVKPILLGSLAARLAGLPRVVNAFAGLGYAFTADSSSARLYRGILSFAFPRLLNRPQVRVMAQNADDAEVLVRVCGLRADKITIIPGSGVDTQRFGAHPEPGGPPVFLMVSRMLWDKGVKEFVEAATTLKAQRPDWRFLLAGSPDPHNPSSIPVWRLERWVEAGAIEWLGERTDIPELLAACHVAVLPSYREGFPKSLLEAAACGRAIVATNAPGCRHLVADGVNGVLVPVMDAVSLAVAMKKLGEDPQTRQAMGVRGRERIERYFSQEIVIGKTFELYREIGLETPS